MEGRGKGQPVAGSKALFINSKDDEDAQGAADKAGSAGTTWRQHMGPETHFSGTVCSVPSCCHGDLSVLQPVVGAELAKNQEGELHTQSILLKHTPRKPSSETLLLSSERKQRSKHRTSWIIKRRLSPLIVVLSKSRGTGG